MATIGIFFVMLYISGYMVISYRKYAFNAGWPIGKWFIHDFGIINIIAILSIIGSLVASFFYFKWYWVFLALLISSGLTGAVLAIMGKHCQIFSIILFFLSWIFLLFKFIIQIKWIFIALAVIILFIMYSRFLRKSGKIQFWNLVNKHPQQAYDFFINNDCWYVIYPNEHKPKPIVGEWIGPFFVEMPGIGRLKIYGKSGYCEIKQEEFMKLYK